MTISRLVAVQVAVIVLLVCTNVAPAQLFKPRPPGSSQAGPPGGVARPLDSPLAPTSPQTRPAIPFGRPPGEAAFGQFAPDAGAPPYWLKEGIRLTYYSSAASIPPSPYYYYPDENGDWVDQHGNRYNRGDNPGPAGHGITQLNVACVDGNLAVIQARSYGYSNVNGPLIPLGTSGYTAPVGQCDWWISPKVLQQTANAESPGMKIMHMPWRQNGKTYKAVAFKRDTQNSHSFSIYDEVTGLLLCSNTSSVAPDRRQTLAQNKFLDWRTVHWPWEKTDAPGWVAATSGLRYRGDYDVRIPGSPPLPVAISATATFGRKAARWASYQLQSEIHGSYGMPSTPSTGEMIAGPSIFGGLWVDPAALRRLRQGQTLDQDKVAGTTVQVTQAGGATVQITEFGQQHKMMCTYDANSGVLVQHVQTDEVLHTIQTLNLAR